MMIDHLICFSFFPSHGSLLRWAVVSNGVEFELMVSLAMTRTLFSHTCSSKDEKRTDLSQASYMVEFLSE